MPQVFLEISVIMGLAIIMSLVMKLLKQPLIIGYILTGILAGPIFFNLISETDSLDAFARIGVALLLFIVG